MCNQDNLYFCLHITVFLRCNNISAPLRRDLHSGQAEEVSAAGVPSRHAEVLPQDRGGLRPDQELLLGGSVAESYANGTVHLQS